MEPQYIIDTKGALIFKLPDGATIRDTGTELHFRANNEQAKRIALQLAKAKWGNNTQLEGGIVKSKSLIYTQPQRSVEALMGNA